MTDQVQPGVGQRLQRTLRDATARIRRLFDPPIEHDAQPLEVREAILEQIDAQVLAAGDGRRALVHNHAVVTLLAPERETRERLQAVLGDLESAARKRLAELRCPVPVGFGFTITYVFKPRPGWTDGQQWSVAFQTRAGATASDAPGTAPPAVAIHVVRGETTEPAYRFTQTRILVGRTALPVDHAGRPRRNDIVFTDPGSEENATVGRAHATIRFDPERHQYRLFDDGSHNGTRIVRDGATIDVPPRNPVGVVLLSGDEILLGSAGLRITIG
jgi:hypothetical protein